MRYHKFLVGFLITLLLISASGISYAMDGNPHDSKEEGDTGDGVIASDGHPVLEASYTEHDPIKINNNSDLAEEATSGSGTENDPYMIEGYDIDGDDYGYGIYIGNTTDHLVVRDCYLHHAHSYDRWEEAGLQVYNITNASIKNNEIEDNDYYGIYLEESSGNTIFNNTVSSNDYEDGIYFSNSENNILENNTVSSNGDYGLYFRYSIGNILRNNTVYGNGYAGVDLYNSDNTILENNTVSSNYDQGIYLYSSDNTVLENNTVSDNSDYGISVRYSEGITLRNTVMTNDGILVEGSSKSYWTTLDIDLTNTVNGRPVRLWKNRTSGTVPTDTGQVILANCTGVTIEDQNIDYSSVGILVGHSTDITLNNNTVNNNDDGIYLHYSENNILENNTADSNRRGFHLYKSDNNRLKNNSFTSNSNDGISVSSSQSNVIEDNDLSLNSDGIYLTSSGSNTLVNNTVSSSSSNGIELYSSDSNVLKNTTVSDSDQDGIYIRNSETNTLKDTTMTDDGILILGTSVEYWNTHDIDTSNTVNGRPVRYWKNRTDGDMPSNTGQVILANCTGVTVENKRYDNSSIGILLGHSDNNHLMNNTLYSNDDGIYLYYSENNLLKNNTAESNRRGIYLDNSHFVTLLNNSLFSNEDYGVHLSYSNSNDIENNTVSPDNQRGIYLSDSDSNTLIYNDVSSNDYQGVYLYSSDSNRIENNALSENGYEGLYLRYSDDNIMKYNDISSNDDNGFYFYNSNNNEIKNNNISLNNYDGIYSSSSSSNRIENNTIESNGDEGIYYYSSGNNEIKNNTISSNNAEGIFFRYSSSNRLENNTIESNSFEGVEIRSSDSNTLKYNTITANNDEGIYLYSSDNNDMENNTVYSNDHDGITLSDSSLNTLRNNTVVDNKGVGINLYSSTDNTTIYHNNIVYNEGQAQDDGDDNTWYSTVLQEGNYWSDYTGTDDNDDGIGDTNYTVDGSSNSNDTYPLMNGVGDDEAPILDADNSPGTGTAGGPYTFDITASDNVLVASVNASWEHGTRSGNLPLSSDGDGTWSGTITLDESFGDMTYRIQVNDTAGYYVRGSEQGVTIIDDVGPDINDKSPDTAYISSEFRFRVNATDLSGVDSVNVSWSHGSLSGNLPLNYEGNDIWKGSIIIDDSTDDLTYRIQANDTLGNSKVSSEQSVQVKDSDKHLRIDSDSELASAASSGSGTETDPYVIENQEIDGDGMGYCIYVGNTTDHFVVRDNTLYNADGNGGQYFRDTGLYFYNVTNGSAEDNTINNNDRFGILLEASISNTILRNDASSNRIGIRLIDSSSDNLIAGNDASSTADTGISIYASDRNILRNNTASRNSYQGILVRNSFDNIIDNNTVSRNYYYGIYLRSSDDNDVWNNHVSMTDRYAVIFDDSHSNIVRDNNASIGNMLGFIIENSDDNIFINNTAYENQYGLGFTGGNSNIIESNDFSNNSYGIYGYDLIDNTFLENMVSFNSNVGIYLRSSSASNLLYHNEIINNAQQAVDDGTDNKWYNGTLQEGNYWSDYSGTDADGDGIGDTSYSIPGGAGSSDMYPLMKAGDSEDPSIDADSSPDQGTTGDPYTFDVTASDNVEVSGVNVSWEHGGSSGNLDLSDDGDGTWSGTMILDHSVSDLIYTVQVNDTSDNYVRGEEQTVTVVDNDGPTADAGGDRTVDEDNPVTFDGSGSTDNVGIVNYTWTIEGGEYYGSNVNYVFSQPGEYTVELEVEDSGGNQDTDLITVTVEDVTRPIADAGGDRTVDEDTEITFDGSDSTDNVGIIRYIWTIEGDQYHGKIVTYTFDRPGVYTVELRVIDSEGNWDTDVIEVDVLDDTDPTADAGEDRTVDEDTEVTFDGSGSSDNVGVVSFTWTIEGSEYHGEMVAHTFEHPGEYTVELNVTDDAGNYDIDTVSVTVLDVTDPRADAGEDRTVDEDTDVTFDGSGSSDNVEIIDYTWTIEGAEYSGEAVTYTFEHPGSYTVILNVTDEAGNYDTDTVNLTVSDATDPKAEAGEDRTVDEDTEVTFDGSGSSDNVEIVSYKWNIEGTEYNGETITYTFEQPGEYTVELNVTDGAGNHDIDTADVTVLDVTDPVAEAGEDKTVDEDNPVTFDGSGSSDNVEIVDYTWTIEGTEYSGETVTHTFEQPGEYTVRLNVSDGAGNFDTDTVDVIVSDVTDPRADAGDDKTVEEDTVVTFSGSDSTDNVEIVDYTWTIEGTEYSGETVTHTFEQPGDYTVALNVTDGAGNSDRGTADVTVLDVTDPSADAGDDRVVDLGSTISFDASGSNDNVGIESYEWSFEYAEGSQSLQGEETQFTFEMVGTYQVTLTVEDATGNSDTDTMTVTVEDNTEPTADAGEDRAVKTGDQITLDASASSDNVEIVSYEWDFGDEETAAGKTVDHRFEEKGTYEVELTVTDEAGNSDTDTVQITVEKKFRVSDLRVDKENPAVGEEIELTVDVTNLGNDEGEHTVEFYVDGKIVGTDTVEVAPGETESASISYKPDDEGDHELTVEDETVTISPEEELTPVLWLLIPIILAVVISVIVIFRKKLGIIGEEDKGSPESEEEE